MMKLFLSLILGLSASASAIKFDFQDVSSQLRNVRKLQADCKDNEAFAKKLQESGVDGTDWDKMADAAKDAGAGKACIEATDNKDCEDNKEMACGMHILVQMKASCPEAYKLFKKAAEDGKEPAMDSAETCDELESADCKAAIQDGYAMSSEDRDDACKDCEKANEGWFCSSAMVTSPSFFAVVFMTLASALFK